MSLEHQRHRLIRVKFLCYSCMNELNQTPIIHKPGQRRSGRSERLLRIQALVRADTVNYIYTLLKRSLFVTTVDVLDVVSRNAVKLILATLAV